MTNDVGRASAPNHPISDWPYSSMIFFPVIPGRLEEANPESRDSQVLNCAP